MEVITTEFIKQGSLNRYVERFVSPKIRIVASFLRIGH